MEWQYVKPLVDVKQIALVENSWNIHFPDDYVAIVSMYNHGMPHPNSFDTEYSRGKSFGELLDFNPDVEDHILIVYDRIKKMLPARVFPFSVTPGGDHLCFDYRNGVSKPEIIYWNHEQIYEIIDNNLRIPAHDNLYDSHRLEFVAGSLHDLLKKLYDEEEYVDEVTMDEIIWENFMSEEKMKGLSDDNLARVNARRAMKNLPPIIKDH